MHPISLLSRWLIKIAAASFIAMPVWALQPPSGEVILTISGKIDDANRENTAVFDLDMLQKLPQQTFVTKTPWDKNPTKFTGPLLRDVLGAVKSSGKTLTALALNDYKTTIPAEDAALFDVIIAHRIDDMPISVRTKGPLFIIYPFDSKPELKSSKYYGRSAWQLKSIKVD